MKTQTKAVKALTPQQVADELGEAYKGLKAEESVLKEKVAEATGAIKEFAEREGEDMGDKVTVKGEVFEVGYYLREGTPKIDQDLAAQLLPKKVLANCTVSFVDGNLLAAAVEKGEVSEGILKKLLIPAKAKTKVLLVRPVKEEDPQ
jgi:hypothetical protein